MIMPVNKNPIFRTIPGAALPRLRGVGPISSFPFVKDLASIITKLFKDREIEIREIQLDGLARLMLLTMKPSLKKRVDAGKTIEEIFNALELSLFITKDNLLYILGDSQNIDLFKPPSRTKDSAPETIERLETLAKILCQGPSSVKQDPFLSPTAERWVRDMCFQIRTSSQLPSQEKEILGSAVDRMLALLDANKQGESVDPHEFGKLLTTTTEILRKTAILDPQIWGADQLSTLSREEVAAFLRRQGLGQKELRPEIEKDDLATVRNISKWRSDPAMQKELLLEVLTVAKIDPMQRFNAAVTLEEVTGDSYIFNILMREDVWNDPRLAKTIGQILQKEYFPRAKETILAILVNKIDAETPDLETARKILAIATLMNDFDDPLLLKSLEIIKSQGNEQDLLGLSKAKAEILKRQGEEGDQIPLTQEELNGFLAILAPSITGVKLKDLYDRLRSEITVILTSGAQSSYNQIDLILAEIKTETGKLPPAKKKNTALTQISLLIEDMESWAPDERGRVLIERLNRFLLEIRDNAF